MSASCIRMLPTVSLREPAAGPGARGPGLRPAHHPVRLRPRGPAQSFASTPVLRRPARSGVQVRARMASEGKGFSHQLFMDTFDYHQQINKHDAIQALRRDQVASGRVYWRMLVDKLAFHETIETLLQRYPREPLLMPFQNPVLPRSMRLRRDLHALADKAHVHMPKPAPASRAARDYVEALDLSARRDPRALAAHAWLHYLGDMHGGQLMRQRLAEFHGADTVHSFGFTQPVEHLKKVYGQALDLPLTAYEQDLLRSEAEAVYQHSLKMHDMWSNP